jgi:hypothetical protein
MKTASPIDTSALLRDCEVHRDAFIVVVRKLAQDDRGLLRDWQQTALLRRHTDARARMGVQHTAGVFTHFMHGAMNDEARRVHFIRCGQQRTALHIDLDQRRGRDLLEHQPIGVDEEMVIRTGNTR